jgi:hypothetical protein
MELELKFDEPWSTVKATGPVVPPDVVTVTLVLPLGALAAIVRVAVICVGLTTATPLTVMPVPALIVAGETKLVPVRVTGTVAPWPPLFGLIELSVGTDGRILPVKVSGFDCWGVLLSETFNVNAYGPAVVGLPLMVTVLPVLPLNVIPAGNVPAMDQLYGAVPPETVQVAE